MAPTLDVLVLFPSGKMRRRKTDCNSVIVGLFDYMKAPTKHRGEAVLRNT